MGEGRGPGGAESRVGSCPVWVSSPHSEFKLVPDPVLPGLDFLFCKG